ncbi:putative branched-subunit amino acid permease [Amorphus suaedae]
MIDPPSPSASPSAMRWFLKGVTKLVSVPAAVLMTAQVGFAALARDAGFSLGETVMIAISVWALPAQVVYVGSLKAGAGWFATILAVSLSSMRFLPMLMAWTPVVRAERTRRRWLFLMSHFVAVTSWVFTMAEMPSTPRANRLAYFTGFAVALVSVNVAAVAIAYVAVGHMPGWLSAALLLLTPLYFLLALAGAGRVREDHLAMGFGLVLGPLLHHLGVGLDLLWTGLVGGTLAYVLGRWKRRHP